MDSRGSRFIIVRFDNPNTALQWMDSGAKDIGTVTAKKAYYPFPGQIRMAVQLELRSPDADTDSVVEIMYNDSDLDADFGYYDVGLVADRTKSDDWMDGLRNAPAKKVKTLDPNNLRLVTVRFNVAHEGMDWLLESSILAMYGTCLKMRLCDGVDSTDDVWIAFAAHDGQDPQDMVDRITKELTEARGLLSDMFSVRAHKDVEELSQDVRMALKLK
jgi:hypothetical protein